MNTSIFQCTYYIYRFAEISDISKEIPKEYQLRNLLADISSRWRQIGLALGISDNDLDDISSVVQDNKSKLCKMITKWIETQSSPVMWDTIIFAIEGPFVSNKKKADEIREFLAKNSA